MPNMFVLVSPRIAKLSNCILHYNDKRDRKVLSELSEASTAAVRGSVGIPPCLYIPMYVPAAQWEEVLYASFYLL